MEYRRLGKSGLQVSALSFGSWVTFKQQLDESAARECMFLAYEMGVNFFDNAEAYAHGESEKIMGLALKSANWGRDTYCVSSKVFWGGRRPTQLGLSRKHVFDACHAALKRLQLEYLDLYFCHRPDPETPIEETVNAMSDLVRQGKVLYWGTSEWSAQQITEAHLFARANHLVAPTMEQPQYNLFHREKVEVEFAPLYEQFGLGTTIWSPLASGILSGKYNRGVPSGSRLTQPGMEWFKDQMESPQGKAQLEKAKKLEKLSSELGCSLAELSLAWCLKNPRVSTVILGASNLKQLKENLGSLEVVKLLTVDVMSRIEEVVQNRPEPPESYR
jgi:voltage-dependent potassium channel beta subunit